MVKLLHLKSDKRNSIIEIRLKEDNLTADTIKRIVQNIKVYFIDDRRFYPQCISCTRKMSMLLGYNRAVDEMKKNINVNIPVFLNKYEHYEPVS